MNIVVSVALAVVGIFFMAVCSAIMLYTLIDMIRDNKERRKK